MSNSVFKWKMQAGRCSFSIPTETKIIGAKEQFGDVVLYGIVDQRIISSEIRTFVLVGTGHTFNIANLIYIDTVVLSGGALVMHVFEDRETFNGTRIE